MAEEVEGRMDNSINAREKDLQNLNPTPSKS